jgi:hypothetical protein
LITGGVMNYELWSQIQQFAPGAYKNSLQTAVFRSRAEKIQVQNILKNVKSLPSNPEVGLAWFPVVNDKTIPIGVLGQIRAILDPQHIFSSSKYGSDVRRKLQRIPILEDWFFCEFGYIPHTFPTFVQDHIPRNWTVQGQSWYFSALVAMISCFLQRAPRYTPICSGTLTFHPLQQITALQDGPIFQGVSDIIIKSQLIEWEFPNSEIPPCLLDSMNNLEHIQFQARNYLDLLFGKTWKEDIYLALRITPRTLAEQGYEFYKTGKKSWAKRIGISVLKGEQDDLVAWSYANYIIGASTKHFYLDEKLDSHHLLLESLEAYRNHPEKSDFDLHYLYQIAANLGISYLLNFQFYKGIDVLEDVFQQLKNFPEAFRDRQWKESTLRVCGSLRWLYIVSGDLDKAEELIHNWNLSRVYVSSAMCRAYYELSDLYRRKSKIDEAKQALSRSRIDFRKVLPNQRPVTYRFLILHEVRLNLRNARYLKCSQNPQSLIDWLEGFEYSLQQGVLLFWEYVQFQFKRNMDRKKIIYIASGFLARFWLVVNKAPNISTQQREEMQNWTLEQVHDLRNQLTNLPEKPSKALQEFSLGSPNKWLIYAPY